MPGRTISVTDGLRAGSRALRIGLVSVVLIMLGASVALFRNLPSANAFNDRVAELFARSDAFTHANDVRLLEILAQSGAAFSQVNASYRIMLFVTLAVAALLLVGCLALLLTIFALTRKLRSVQRTGMDVVEMRILRGANQVSVNHMTLQLTPAALETLAILAEARMDDDVLSGAQIESMISGRPVADCDEAAGATRIKRLRDMLGNQLVTEVLIQTIPKQGYVLAIPKSKIDMV